LNRLETFIFIKLVKSMYMLLLKVANIVNMWQKDVRLLML